MPGEHEDDTANNNPLLEALILIDKSDVPRRFFLLAVMVIAVAPRMPLDDRWSIGGNLSNNFRKLVLAIGLTNLFKNIVLHDGYDGLSLVLLALEGVSLTFLSLLTPYLLRVWMEERINIPGGRQPGKGLLPWVQAFVVLTSIGVVLRMWTHKMVFWVFKKIADMLSFIPVMRTLQLYNSITTAQVLYPGRGSVLSQIVVVAEYYSLVSNGCDVFVKSLQLLGFLGTGINDTVFMRGIYMNIFYANYTRVLCHSIMLNVLDEAYTIGSSCAPTGSSEEAPRSESSAPHRDGPTFEVVDEESEQVVALLP